MRKPVNIGKKHKAAKEYFFVLISLIAAFAGILFGYDTGVISGAILFINEEFALTHTNTSMVISVVLLGAFTGSLFSSKLADFFGRKVVLLWDAVLFCLATILSSLAWNMTLLIFARFIVGIAIGISSYVAPLYVSEISPTKHRGALVSLNQLAINFGILLSYVVDYSLADESAWRSMLLAGVLPALFFFAGMLFLPPSPRWMVFAGQKARALRVLKRIRKTSLEATREIEQIQANMHLEKGTVRALFKKKLRPALFVGTGLAFIQQVTGINTIIYFAPTIFEKAGFVSDSSAILATMGVGAVLFLSTGFSLFLVDTLGRRVLLLVGIFLMGLGLLGLSLSFTSLFSTFSFTKSMSLITMMLYIFGFSIGLGPIMWVMMSEVFPLHFRALGASISTSTNWIANFLVTATFLSILDLLGTPATFFLYFLITILGFFFVFFYVPETKGISLERIEKRLYSGQFFPKRRT